MEKNNDIRTFFIADLHFGHKGVTQFLGPDGVNKLRPWDDTEDMDSALIANWNSVVRPKDKVYVLGDLTVNKKHIHKVGQCNGRKFLVMGNHDNGDMREYLTYFEKVWGVIEHKGCVLSHVPVHSNNLGRWPFNIHGHLHAHKVKTEDGWNDPRYICVSVEQTGYMPISWQILQYEMEKRKELFPDFF